MRDAQTRLWKEEFVLDMVQSSKLAAMRDAQKMLWKEEFVTDTGQRSELVVMKGTLTKSSKENL